jgi:SAM-dependent methyltransferase
VLPQTKADTYRIRRTDHWDAVADEMRHHRDLSETYHHRLETIYRFLVAPGQRVIELGCGNGDLLAATQPSVGVGIDFSAKMVTLAQERHPDLRFLEADIHDLELDETFDVVILSDLVNDIWDVQSALEKVHQLCTPRTRIIINVFSRTWQAPLNAARRLGLARPLLEQNWLSAGDVANLLDLADFDVIKQWEEILWPLPPTFVGRALNRYVAKTWPVRHLDLAQFIVARPRPKPAGEPPSVSVIVPTRNEAGNIHDIIRRTPELGSGTELIFVEGNSTDDTYDVIEAAIPEYPSKDIKLLRQPGAGKGDAVRVGFEKASGDVLMILDADLTVPPEDLPRFVEALTSGKGEFINGVRLVYPMERQAMQFLNLIGNKLFGLLFTWLLGQRVKDTLCGTKVLRRRDYELVAANRSYFGNFDPFGDFDLLFGAAKLNMKIVDLPIRYRERTYGDTNISRWRHGVLLLRMAAFAARRIKFI